MSEGLESDIEKIQDLANRGRYFESAHIAKKLARENPMNSRLRQLAALAMSKSGAPKMAAEFLEPIYSLNPDDIETAGILGGIYKSIFRKNQDPHFGNLSFETYLKNYQSTGSYYTGINAASMSTLIGLAGRGRKIASELVDNLDPNDFWQLATLAEAKLLLKERDVALDYYIKTRQMAGSDWGKVESIRSQLWLLNHIIQVPKAIMDLFEAPRITAFVGHMIDHPQRKSPRFTPDMEAKVKEAIRSMVQSMDISIGYCSLACGSDILFAEVMMEENKEVNILIPFDLEDFRQKSVSFAGSNWGERFDQIVNNRKITLLTNSQHNGNNEYFTFVGKVIMGSAIVRAKMNGTEPALLSVLSNFDLENKAGGTRDSINTWPYPEDHQNVNIDVYKTESLQAIAQPNQTPDIPVAEQEINETISNILICQFSNKELLSVDNESGLLSSLMDYRDEMIIAPIFFSLVDNKVVAVINSAYQVMEIISLIKQKIRNFSDFKLGVHAGPVQLRKHSTEELGEHFKVAQKLTESSIANTIMATKGFTSLIAVESQRYKYDHTGFMDSEDGLEIEIFRIEEDRF